MTHCARVESHCGRCDKPLPFEFTMAFQPIVDVELRRVVAFEALVRGPRGESAGQILGQVDESLLYRFDQACRVKAIELASQLDMQEKLSINFLPNAVYEPTACIQATLEAAQRVAWPIERINFEIVESEAVTDRAHLRHIVDSYREMGFSTALDDFGTGYANLDLLTELRLDTLKLDRQLVMQIDSDPRRQAMVHAVIAMAADLGCQLIAEGIETLAEARWLKRAGIARQQGYFFARPGLESLPEVPAARFAELDA
ncbi:EAL domain-containing protein [Halomonas sp. HP20-15]|uniref:EAL domain-containing protein n=1 Tax=Halomonas sp. HP20-15 TaxID=3085901 RepID=UPI0029827D80|nr:EAL domain-containing protein [Halomonas sp. HP20-15]MDW5378327.1 EAL domain-containing protein [Halomonas sp. HP20-15]